nr:MAG TPA: hypothetical protein [Bacteriophage sp.]
MTLQRYVKYLNPASFFLFIFHSPLNISCYSRGIIS